MSMSSVSKGGKRRTMRRMRKGGFYGQMSGYMPSGYMNKMQTGLTNAYNQGMNTMGNIYGQAKRGLANAGYNAAYGMGQLARNVPAGFVPMGGKTRRSSSSKSSSIKSYSSTSMNGGRRTRRRY